MKNVGFVDRSHLIGTAQVYENLQIYHKEAQKKDMTPQDGAPLTESQTGEITIVSANPEILAVRYSLPEILMMSYATRSGQHATLGATHLTLLYSQALLDLHLVQHVGDGLVYRVNENTCIAIRNIALHLWRNLGHYNLARDMITSLAANLFSFYQTNTNSIWELALAEIQFEHYYLKDEWSKAENYIKKISLYDETEAALRSAELYLKQKRRDEAFTISQACWRESFTKNLVGNNHHHFHLSFFVSVGFFISIHLRFFSVLFHTSSTSFLSHTGHFDWMNAQPIDFQDPYIFDTIYESFIQEIDAIDNGVSICEGKPRYTINSDLSTRVGHSRPNWNEEATNEVLYERFQQALVLVGQEFHTRVSYYSRVWYPPKKYVQKLILIIWRKAAQNLDSCPIQPTKYALNKPRGTEY
uniref:Uncharacterized protein n=1 Tax=Tetranychus urticae TaxID=32264 RepID=T1KBY1_TETUR